MDSALADEMTKQTAMIGTSRIRKGWVTPPDCVRAENFFHEKEPPLEIALVLLANGLLCAENES